MSSVTSCHLLILFCFVFQDRVSLCNPDYSGTHSVDQAGLELRDLLASASQILGLKVCAITTQPQSFESMQRLCLYVHLRIFFLFLEETAILDVTNISLNGQQYLLP